MTDKIKNEVDYVFKNGDKVCIGFKIFQVIDGQLRQVMDFIDIDGQETFYIEPGKSFTYMVM
jgi:hypothetical protein